MTKLFVILLALPMTLFAQKSVAESNVVHLACIGDSITEGGGVSDREQDSYPAQLARLLGPGWEVRNFGVGGRTIMQHGDGPYDQCRAYRAMLESKPDVAVIALGTNDSKPQNIGTNPGDFVPSYRDLIAKLRQINPEIRIYVCYPVPAFPENFGIHDDVITGQIIPMIEQVAKDEGVPVIDLHAALADQGALFPDKVHPNEAGAALIANAVYKALSGMRDAN